MCASDYIENCFLQASKKAPLDFLYANKAFSKEEVLEQFLLFIKRKLKFSIVKWEPSHKEYPSYMFLSGDKGILAYVDFKYIESEEKLSDTNLVCDSRMLLKTIRSADSQLDRPVFFVYIVNCKDKQGVFFETNEQIKDRWLNNFYPYKWYAPVIDEMGDINNLISLWTDLKKNNVRV